MQTPTNTSQSMCRTRFLASPHGSVDMNGFALFVIHCPEGTRKRLTIPSHLLLGVVERFGLEIERLVRCNRKFLFGRFAGVPINDLWRAYRQMTVSCSSWWTILPSDSTMDICTATTMSTGAAVEPRRLHLSTAAVRGLDTATALPFSKDRI